ncbi:hypothetical protein GCM10009608_78430 [Pseudonocardia alaniniphila]
MAFLCDGAHRPYAAETGSDLGHQELLPAAEKAAVMPAEAAAPRGGDLPTAADIGQLFLTTS